MADVPVEGCNVCFDTAGQEVRPVSTDERSRTENVYQGWFVPLSSAVCLWTFGLTWGMSVGRQSRICERSVRLSLSQCDCEWPRPSAVAVAPSPVC